MLITVGRAAKEKNIEELIHYFKRLDMENTVFLIVGGGPYLNSLKETAKAENISDRVFFTGQVEPQNVALYYKLGDVFMSASQSETQGLTYIEALAGGLPAVCKKDACLDDVVTNGENGGQYTDFDEFSHLVREILSNAELYKKMSENAVRTAQRYSAKNFAKNMESVYTDVLEKRNQNEITNTFYNCKNCG